MKDINEKYLAVMLLHALGDTLGFKNGDWEFNYHRPSTLNMIMEFVSEFVQLGGININLDGWHISDDTLYHIATANTLLNYNGSFNKKFMLLAKNEMGKIYNRIGDDSANKIYRYPGKTIHKAIEKFTDEIDERNLPYDSNSGGNGAAMKALCIGMAFHTNEDLDKLIECSIEISKMTHNSPIGYLAGLTAAYFTSLAISNVEIIKWPYLLYKLLSSGRVKKFVNKTNDDEYNDYISYLKYWEIYIVTRFSNGNPIDTRSTANLLSRMQYYYDNFVDKTKANQIGISGFCAMIMAYDCLLDCDGIWEKLIFYAILNPSDSDTVGAIAGGLFGAVYGFETVPTSMLTYLEEKDLLTTLANKLYKKFYLNENIKLQKSLNRFTNK